MGIPVFSTTANSDPPWNFKVWLDEFFVAVTVKENVNPEILMEDPKPVIKDSKPRPKTPRTNEDAVATAARETRDRLMKDRIAAENAERRERGPKERTTTFITTKNKKILYRDYFLPSAQKSNINLYRIILTQKSQN